MFSTELTVDSTIRPRTILKHTTKVSFWIFQLSEHYVYPIVHVMCFRIVSNYYNLVDQERFELSEGYPDTWRLGVSLLGFSAPMQSHQLIYNWCVRVDSNHQQYHTKNLADSQGTRTLCPNCRRAVYHSSTHTLYWLRGKYSKLLGRAYETDRSPESPRNFWVAFFTRHIRPSVMIRLLPYLQDEIATILHLCVVIGIRTQLVIRFLQWVTLPPIAICPLD